MKRILLIMLALLLCLSFASCGEDETSDTSGEVSFRADNNMTLSQNIKIFLQKGEEEGYDTLSATFFSGWKKNNVRELSPKTPPHRFYSAYKSLHEPARLVVAKYDYVYPNGIIKERIDDVSVLEYGVTYFPFECVNVIDDDQVAFSFCASEGDNIVYYVFIYYNNISSWSTEGYHASFTSVDEAEAYIQRGGKYEKHEVSENMDWSTGPY